MAMVQSDVVAVQNYVPQVMISPEQALQAYKSLKEVTKMVLVKDVDYGIVPGTPKPSLLKPGAENLLRFYGLGHTVEKVTSTEDWENGFFYFEYKVSVHKTFPDGTKHILSECVGSSNSREPKFYKKKDGTLRNAYEQVNTFQKMAIKRALVGAALQATGASGLFTQDIEDFEDIGNGPGHSQSKGSRSSGSSNKNNSGTKNVKARVFDLRTQLGWGWNDLTEFASSILGRPLQKLVNDVKSEQEWEFIEQHLIKYIQDQQQRAQQAQEFEIPSDEQLGF